VQLSERRRKNCTKRQIYAVQQNPATEYEEATLLLRRMSSWHKAYCVNTNFAWNIDRVKVTLRLTVSQSVSKSWCRAHLLTSDQIMLPFQVFGSGICCPVSVGRPLWRAAGSVLCKSQSSDLSVCTFTILSFTHLSLYIHISSSSGHNGSLNTWTVVNMTAAKFEPWLQRPFSFSWFCMASACRLHDFAM
jgi:hypothetical protein